VKVEFDKSFEKSIRKLNNRNVAEIIVGIISEIEEADSITKIHGLKKLTGYKDYFRIRIGDYRIGFRLVDSMTIRFIIVANRKDIYKLFP